MAESPLLPTPLIFDRSLLRARRRRAAGRSPPTFLLDRAAADLADRLATVLRRFPRALDLGTPGDAVRAALARLGSVGTVVTANASPVTASAGAALSVAAKTKKRSRFATPPLISWSRRCHCNSSTTCRERSYKSAARSSPTACFLPR